MKKKAYIEPSIKQKGLESENGMLAASVGMNDGDSPSDTYSPGTQMSKSSSIWDDDDAEK